MLYNPAVLFMLVFALILAAITLWRTAAEKRSGCCEGSGGQCKSGKPCCKAMNKTELPSAAGRSSYVQVG